MIEAIRQADPALKFRLRRADILAAVGQILDSGHLVLGPAVAAFEASFALYIGTQHAIGVASGTDALTLALEAFGVSAGDEVATVSLTSPATAAAIAATGATIRYVDVDADTRGMSPSHLAAAICSKTKAVVPVHLHGTPCRIDEIIEIAKQHNVPVIEDCAQAHGGMVDGRRVGSFGDAAAFSFYPTKNLGCLGDGGAVTTSRPDVAAHIRRTRQYGWSQDRISLQWGMNSRLDEVQAAVLNLLLPELDANNAQRQACAKQYRELLHDTAIVLPVAFPGSVYHQFCVEVSGRNAVAENLRVLGIDTAMHYSVGLHQHPRFRDADAHLPVTEYLSARLLSLPIQPEIAEPHGARIAAALKAAVA